MVFTAEWFKASLIEEYQRFVERAKVPQLYMQVRLEDGRDFWTNEVAYGPTTVSFFQRVTEDYLVMFVVPYEEIGYIIFHSQVPPEYRAPEKRPVGFKMEVTEPGLHGNIPKGSR